MKHLTKLLFLLVFSVLSFSFKSLGEDDPNLKLSFTKQDWKIDMFVSYNGDEGKTGKLIIFNSKGQFVTEFDVLLKKSPDFFAINLNEYGNDTYKIELTTESGKTHVSHLEIK